MADVSARVAKLARALADALDREERLKAQAKRARAEAGRLHRELRCLGLRHEQIARYVARARGETPGISTRKVLGHRLRMLALRTGRSPDLPMLPGPDALSVSGSIPAPLTMEEPDMAARLVKREIVETYEDDGLDEAGETTAEEDEGDEEEIDEPEGDGEEPEPEAEEEKPRRKPRRK